LYYLNEAFRKIPFRFAKVWQIKKEMTTSVSFWFIISFQIRQIEESTFGRAR